MMNVASPTIAPCRFIICICCLSIKGLQRYYNYSYLRIFGIRYFDNMRYFVALLGLISLVLGIIGIFLPVLPTTPFLLLSAALFLRSSKPLYDWLMNHPQLGPYIRNFMVHKSIPLRVKIISVSMVWVTLIYCAVAVAGHWLARVFFIVLAAGITFHILSYKTMR